VVFQQMLTIFFATGVGVAIVLYATRSRRSAAPSSLIGQGAAVQAYVAAETFHASVSDVPVVEASSVYQSQVVNEVPSATTEVATPTTEAAAAVAAPVVEAMTPIIVVEPTVMMESQASAVVSATAPAETPAETTTTTERPRRVRGSSRRRSSGTASTRTRSRASQKTTEQTS
jgi:hypothetical protein